MKLEEIAEEWSADCASFNPLDLFEEQHKAIRQLAKYVKYKSIESAALRAKRTVYAKLRADKEDFLQNPTVEVMKEKGWQVPPKGRLLKADIANYLAKDKEIVQAELAIGVQEEKVELLKEILKQLNNRSYSIRNMLDDRKYMSGG
jgi:hypothetical protein